MAESAVSDCGRFVVPISISYALSSGEVPGASQSSVIGAVLLYPRKRSRTPHAAETTASDAFEGRTTEYAERSSSMSGISGVFSGLLHAASRERTVASNMSTGIVRNLFFIYETFPSCCFRLYNHAAGGNNML